MSGAELLAQVALERPADDARYRRLRARFHQAGSAPGWRHQGPAVQGHFLEEGWSLGDPDGERPGSREYALTLIHRGLAHAFGLGFRARMIPEEDGWGVSLGLSIRGQGVSGSWLSLCFRRHRAGACVEAVEVLGGGFASPEPFSAEAPHDGLGAAVTRDFQVAPEASGRDPDAARLAALREALRDAGALRRHGLAASSRLEAHVLDEITAGRVCRLEAGGPLAPGLPPRVRGLPLGRWESWLLRARVRWQLGVRRRRIRALAEPWLAAVRTLGDFPTLLED